ncbi:hypothetical protein WR25_23716 [Diploscapter pachys]|uniref:Myotubularin phosphatase domain-containing protein n=1 Tax=Diploscapter pachys TaxID=2018661 RepID=A0A2A2M3T9_9BILA|nr:hypothetical protein WR25_23716 [Diploscapter pachys]
MANFPYSFFFLENCDTYPERLWLPTSANANVVVGSTKFRSRGRLPALTYFYRPTGAVICRCAQPLTGFSARNVEDEKLMELIGKASGTGEVLYMIDTRPKVRKTKLTFIHSMNFFLLKSRK